MYDLHNSNCVRLVMAAKILLAEDEKALSLSLTLKLTNAGFDVVCAADGVQAVDLMSKSKFDLLLLDLLMPKLDGFGVLEVMKAKNIKLKTVVLSNLAQDEEMTKSKTYGVDEYWVKTNFSLSEIVDRVKKLIDS